MLHHKILVFVLLLSSMLTAGGAELQNQLADNPSPYLAMHGEDPVHWQTWSRETLQKARELNRPLLVSIGYFSCHWCHVMQRESYRDPALAKVLNEYFIPVKVDRELDPALDAHLIEFVQLTQGRAGWPLNVFLTPEGYPLVGMTYVPRDRFAGILEALHQRWAKQPEELRQAARNGLDEWRRLRKAKAGKKPVNTSAIHNMMVEAQQLGDELDGGFGQQNKFPMAAQLRTLLWIRSTDDRHSLDDFLTVTLNRMAGQGMHDQVGGGFFRYSTDPGWQIPHYEKMLYDNAQLVVLYLEAAAQFDAQQYRNTALDTLDFMLREMQRDDGCFIGSFSAVDAQGREGFYYQWKADELKKLLDAEQLAAVRAAWFNTAPADSEYGRLPRWQGTPAEIAVQLGWKENRLEQVLAAARQKLQAARQQRSLLPDTKGLAAWNGLALSALAAGYAATDDRRYRQAGEQLTACIIEGLWDGSRLVRAREDEQVLAAATLEDYALVAQGLYDWNRQVGDQALQVAAEAMVRLAWKRYYRNQRWLQSDTPLIPMLDGRIALDDSPLPSATAALSALGLQLDGLKGDQTLHEHIQAHLDQVRALLGDSVFWYAGYVPLLEVAD